ncbi:MAG: CCA tRNA nucleotidyltransferase [Hyphomicrobiales bacterium]|nr:CCA tRNA nucleotidyltransferase [Hyphomicrobiales bacterium]
MEYTDSWEEDAARRDFTVNAMSLERDGTLHDYLNGREDLEKGIIRFVGKPEERIQGKLPEDFAVVRFHALYGKAPITEASLDACREHGRGITSLSGERVQREMFKLFGATDPTSAIEAMAS